MKALLTLFALGTVMFAQTPAPSAALTNPAALKEQAPEKFNVKFSTTAGDFVIEVTRSWAPRGADRFYNLVKHGFYNDAAFFRFVPGFIVQWGIPADPKLAAIWQKARIPDDPKKGSNTRGTVVFATAGPNTRTTQLFINFSDRNSALDADGFVPFGKVVEGMTVVEKIYPGYGEKPDQGQIQAQGKAYLQKNFPRLDTIKSTTIVEGSAAPAKK